MPAPRSRSPRPATRAMPNHDAPPPEHLEHAREMIWEAAQILEDAQRVLFRAGDGYVTAGWGAGVRSLLQVTERITDVAGELTAIHIEIGHLARRTKGRDTDPPV